jgi:CubicO group peptidase (beta-lactamase class C family)
MMKNFFPFLFLVFSISAKAQSLYFPPLSGNTWQTNSPQSLGWNLQARDSLLQYLQAKNSKAFIILKEGKIVLENYFNGFGQDSIWYWASAGKTITSLLIGRCQEEGLLSIQDSTSKYLGQGWTSATPAQEGKIKIFHNLTMTTGLDWDVPDNDCTADTCLKYKSQAGTEWYYYNAPYLLLQDVVASASGISLQQFTNNRLLAKTGMRGLWFDGVFYSKARDMARFGLLTLAKGIWNGNPVLGDTAYFRQAINTSQNLNRSYGYLWWLNGKTSHKLPATQLTFNGPMVPSGPSDMVMALGKNDQKIYVVPSQNLVVIRMGESAGNVQLALSSFDTELWTKISAMIGLQTSAKEPLGISPTSWQLDLNGGVSIPHQANVRFELFSVSGKKINESENRVIIPEKGVFLVQATLQDGSIRRKLFSR